MNSLSKDVTTKIKDKYLDYCRANLYWIKDFSDPKSGLSVLKIADGVYRPPGMFILGVITAIAPEEASVIPVFLKINGDPDTIIKALGLNFNPEQELKKLDEERAKKLGLESDTDIELRKLAEENAKPLNPETVPITPEIDPDVAYLNEIRKTL